MLVDLKRKIRVEDLAEGNIFDGDELIIENFENGFTSLRREDASKNCRVIRRYHYDFLNVKGEARQINNNGHGDFYPEDSEFREYDRVLKGANL